MSAAVGTGSLKADVKPAQRLDRLVVVPREPGQGIALLTQLRLSLPGVALRRSPEGVSVPAVHSEVLLDLEGSLDLRWSPEARVFAQNRRWVKDVHEEVRRRIHSIHVGGSPTAHQLLSDLRGSEILDEHQLINVAAMTVPHGYGMCLFDEQGTGKTVTMIFTYDLLVERDEVDFALIVAPKSMVTEWPHDFRRFRQDTYSIGVVAGNQRAKRAVIRQGADVLVTNFETCISMEVELRAVLRRHGRRAILVVDESFYIKSLDALRTLALRRLREWCGRAFVLCGTPAPNSPEDLVQQFNLVDFGLTFEGISVPKDRELARGLVQEALNARGAYLRNLKHDVLRDLPAKAFHRLFVTLAPQQKRLYAGALNDLIVDLQSTSDQDFVERLGSFLARRTALLQICSNPVGVLSSYREVPGKIVVLDQLLERIVGELREKAIIWSFFTASIDALLQRYQRFSPVRYDGSVQDVQERRDAVGRFQEDSSTYLFVGNPAAAGAGLTLHRARFAIYESMSNQAAHYLQSLDRIHRRGQTRDVNYIVLLGQDTIEVAEYDRLLSKEASAQALLGDRVREPVSRVSMLNELLGLQGHVVEMTKSHG